MLTSFSANDVMFSDHADFALDTGVAVLSFDGFETGLGEIELTVGEGSFTDGVAVGYDGFSVFDVASDPADVVVSGYDFALRRVDLSVAGSTQVNDTAFRVDGGSSVDASGTVVFDNCIFELST